MQILEIKVDPDEWWAVFKKIFWSEELCHNDTNEGTDKETDIG